MTRIDPAAPCGGMGARLGWIRSVCQGDDILDDQRLIPETLRAEVLRHLTYTLGKDAPNASIYDWRMALSYAIRDRIVEPWFAATRRTWAEDRKRVYYLSMEFLIGRILEDATVNLGLRDQAQEVMASLGQDFSAIVEDEPDAALGNGGLGRLAACFMESMATVGCPAYGYGIRYEHGLFRQRFQNGQQIEAPEDWLRQTHPWEFARPESAYTIPFKGSVETRDGKPVWMPGETVLASAHDTPVIGWQGKWANTLRLWEALPTQMFDLERFNRGDYAAAAEPEALARTLSRVLYPDDTTYQGKELRLKQEFFLTSAALQDILRRFKTGHTNLRDLPKYVAIQMNDTHPAIAGPELVRLLSDENGMSFDDAMETAQACLGYTNHTLLPEALERWATFTFGSVLPRHMQIVEQIDSWHRRTFSPPHYVGIVKHQEVRMGELAFVMAHKVNGVSALHSDLVKKNLFLELNRLHPGRIINQTNGVTPRRWLKMANRPLAGLITETIGEGWEADLDRLRGLEAHVDDGAFRMKFDKAKRANKVALAGWIKDHCGVTVSPDALFDVQVKRIHEYKRQLLNVLHVITHYNAILHGLADNAAPRCVIFAGKAASSYYMAKQVIRLIHDVANVINSDARVMDKLKVVFVPNYGVSVAELIMPAADLSEQISTAGTEASGTGNMKFSMNGALTIGTEDGANIEIRDNVGAENIFIFGNTTPQVEALRRSGYDPKSIYHSNAMLNETLNKLDGGFFSPSDRKRYHDVFNSLVNYGDHYLLLADYPDYITTQAKVDALYLTPTEWQRKAILNVAGMGAFSSDRTIRDYAIDTWNMGSLLKKV